MERTPMRFAVAGIIHETNTYAAEFSGLTPLAAFEQYWGQRVAEVFDNANHQVGGFIEGARRVGAMLDYAFVGQATPSGTIDAAAEAIAAAGEFFDPEALPTELATEQSPAPEQQ